MTGTVPTLKSDMAQAVAFYEAALAAGGKDEGTPGGRADYSEPYCGCFVHDSDGHKIEAAFWDEQLEQQLNQNNG